ncbi:D-ribose pyranase [Cohnella thermotolerans]|uniref:D-ribose pyranase n=1 Tax=Cohnella thermotolerans TaxID=329858 RepID=UPI00047E762D|nr:D-ribose pyranase [Cohnella thermotolerans]
MKKTTLMNRELSGVIAGLGHTDLLTVCDGGFPVPKEPLRLDLAVRPQLPRFFDVLDTILEELCVEKIFIATETKEISPNVYEEMLKRFPDAQVELLPHAEFKKLSREAKATVRTGEHTPYSNIILQSGVVY